MSKAAAEVGSTANSYQILAKLATGGMAEIFLARGEGVAGVERYCVLKRILRDRASDVQFVRMFLDEARLAAQLQHPNIAQVYDIGKLADSYFFTMEYVHGETVRALLHRAQGLRRRLPITCVLTIAAGTAAGLHHAHTRLGRDGRALGIVHRDVSPSNLMVSYEGGVKVVDFGVAKAADRGHETKSGTVKGKISYLSPEQCKGKRVDRRSDLFSLGICMWEMLTTDRLYKRASDFENMNAIVTEPTPPPSSRRTDVPAEVDELVMRLLAKAPEERYQTADELVEAIEDVASRTGSVLSSSALGRFVRELFGQRPEPWLDLENQQEAGEAVTVTSEPIPRELVVPAGDAIDQRFASVVDLSPRSITESLSSLDSKSPEVPTTRLGKRAALGFPMTSPPPRRPTLPLDNDTDADADVDPDADIDADGPPALPPPPMVRPASSGSRTSSLSAAELLPASQPEAVALPGPADAPVPAALAGRADAPVPAALALAGPPASFAAPSKQLPLPASPTASIAAAGTQVPSGSPTASFAAPATQVPSGSPTASFTAQGTQVPPPGAPPVFAASASGSFAMLPAPHAGSSGPRMASSGSFASPAGSHGSLPAAAPYAVRQRGWPLYAVMTGAAVLGAIAVMAMMRSSADTSGALEAATATLASKPSDPTQAGPGAPAGNNAITAVPIDPPPTAVPASAAVELAAGGTRADIPAPADDTAGAAGPAGDDDDTRGSARPPGHRRQVGTERAAPSRAAAPGGMSAAAASPVEETVQPGHEIQRSFSAGSYERVVELCGAGPVSAEHAPLCIIAACHARNAAKASKLIGAAPAGKRDQLISHCKQLGVDIAPRKQPPRPAAVDCEADPMACQH